MTSPANLFYPAPETIIDKSQEYTLSTSGGPMRVGEGLGMTQNGEIFVDTSDMGGIINCGTF